MGCDIHLYVEYKSYDRWENFGGEIYIPRDYGLFTVLANVRNYHYGVEVFEPKGIPKDIASETKKSYTLEVIDNMCDNCYGYCTQEQAEKYVESALKYDEPEHGWWDERKTRVVHPDWHSASWLSLEELKLAYQRYLSFFKKEDISWMEELRQSNLSMEEKVKKFRDMYDLQTKLIPVERIAEIDAIISAMEKLGETRVVFWFDN